MNKRLFQGMLTILSLTILSGCDNGSNFAPVADIGGMDPIPRSGVHRVRHGESLYEIAWRYGMDYRVLAERNHMNSPYYIHTGELIYLRGTSPSGLLHSVQLAQSAKETDSIRASAPPVLNKSLTFSAAQKPDVEPNYPITAWIWPAKGKIINTFSSYNKGINIAGSRGEAIHAAAAGKVVYCGDGLRGYGNLIIIKHNSLYLSAYAHNRKVYVREGDWVRQGQKIAEMGNTGSDKVMLHFEIRRAGKPIDPASLL